MIARTKEGFLFSSVEIHLFFTLKLKILNCWNEENSFHLQVTFGGDDRTTKVF